MIDTNRLAYWPSPPDYSDTMCIKVSYHNRSVNRAYDISYNAQNYLYIWESATRDPQYGGGFAATYINLPISDCRSLITTLNKKLPLSAANSMNYVASCLAQDTSWVANHYELWNIVTPACIYGVEEECVLDLAVSNQPTCPHQLDLQMPLTTLPVYDIEYGTGKKVLAI